VDKLVYESVPSVVGRLKGKQSFDGQGFPLGQDLARDLNSVGRALPNIFF